jgi:hypothetical protein
MQSYAAMRRKCLFMGTDMFPGDKIDTFTFGLARQKGEPKSDVVLHDVLITSYGYTCSATCTLSGSKSKEVTHKLPQKFKLVYVNECDEEGLEAINAFCDGAHGSPIGIDTEGGFEGILVCEESVLRKVGKIDVIQIASLKSNSVLVVSLRTMRNSGRVPPKFVWLLTRSRVVDVYADMGGRDDEKINHFFEQMGIEAKCAKTNMEGFAEGMRACALRMDFSFDFKRNGTRCIERGFRILDPWGWPVKTVKVLKDKKGPKEYVWKEWDSTAEWQKKNLVFHSSRFFHPRLVREDIVDIGREMPSCLMITVSTWENSLLTLEQTTYAALDAWITLWSGLFLYNRSPN